MKNNYPHLSFTQFNIYSKCRRMWHILYPEGKDQPKRNATKNAIFGSFLHEVYAEVNRFIKSLKNKSSFGIEDIEKIYSEQFKKVNLSLEDYQTGWKSLEKYALETFNTRAEILLVEEQLQLELTDGKEGIAIVAIPDRVDEVGDAMKIIDFKLSPLIPSYSDVEHSLQLNIYAYILKQLYPNKQIFIEQYSMTRGMGIKAAVNDAIQAKLSNYMVDLWQKMKADKDFTPSLCNLCQYCPDVCEDYKEFMGKTYESKGIKSLQDALQAFEKAKVNVNLMTKEKDSLKEFIEAAIEKNNGEPITEGNKTVILEVGSRSTKQVDKEKICKECTAITFGKSFFNTIEIINNDEAPKEKKAAKKIKKT